MLSVSIWGLLLRGLGSSCGHPKETRYNSYKFITGSEVVRFQNSSSALGGLLFSLHQYFLTFFFHYGLFKEDFLDILKIVPPMKF